MRLISFCIAAFLMSLISYGHTTCEEEVQLFKVETVLNGKTILKVNNQLLATIVESSPEVINFNLPISNTKSIHLELFKASIFAEDFKVKSSSGKSISAASVGVPYSGIIDGNKIASFLFLPDNLIGMYSEEAINYQIARNSNSIFELTSYPVEAFEMNCLTEDSDAIINDITAYDASKFIQDKPIDVYIEVNYEYPYLRDGKINKLAMAVFNFHQTAQLFQNEEISIRISEIFVWDTKSPYGGGSKKSKESPSMPQFLNRFKKHRKTFNGDVALLFVENSSYGTGIASKVGGLCGNKPSDRMAVTKTYWDYATEYPKHSRGYKMPAHELGHLFGSGHTYNCSWNNNKTSLDNCKNRGKNCRDTRVNYDNRKDSDYTIMSYCETKADLLRGFGVQPGNLIRRFIANADCLKVEPEWQESLTLHHLIESDPYETYNAKYKAENIHAFNQIKDNTTAVLVAKKAIYLKEGFVAKAGSDVQLKINNDNVPVVKPNKVYETTIKSYSIDNVINSYTYKDENEIKSIVVIDALGNELEEIDLSDPNYLIRPGFFYGFYMLKITYVDGSIKIRKK